MNNFPIMLCSGILIRTTRQLLQTRCLTVRLKSTVPEQEISSGLIKFECQHHLKGVYTLGLCRHDKKNALSRKLIDLLEAKLDDVSHMQNVRVLLIYSEVSGSFCTGADLKERISMKPQEVAPFVDRLRGLFDRISRLAVPTIAAIDGVALGGGLELALACDLRVVSSNAMLGLPETKLAIIPGAGGTQRLPRIVGTSFAKDLIFTGRIVDGSTALSIGLVNYLVDQTLEMNAAYQEALKISAGIASRGPVAIKAAKFAIDYGSTMDMESSLKLERTAYSKVIPTQDRLEGLRSFLEKRSPNYEGK